MIKNIYFYSIFTVIYLTVIALSSTQVSFAAYEVDTCKSEIMQKNYELGNNWETANLKEKIINIWVTFSQKWNSANIDNYKAFLEKGISSLSQLQDRQNFNQTQNTIISIVKDFLSCQRDTAVSTQDLIGSALAGINPDAWENITTKQKNQWDSPDDRVCTSVYAPVCWIDWVTYSNSCLAEDTEIDYQWFCRTNTPNFSSSGWPSSNPPDSWWYEITRKCSLEKFWGSAFTNVNVNSESQCLEMCDAAIDREWMSCKYRVDNTTKTIKIYQDDAPVIMNTKIELDCNLKWDTVSWWYYSVGRCPDQAWYTFWKWAVNTLVTKGTSQAAAEFEMRIAFREALTRDCSDNIPRLMTFADCYNRLFCEPWYEYELWKTTCRKK